MKKLAILILKYRIKLAEKQVEKYRVECTPIVYAYETMIKTYRSAILFLEVEH